MASFKTQQTLSDLAKKQDEINRLKQEKELSVEAFAAAEADANRILKTPAAELAETQIGVATPVDPRTAELSAQGRTIASEMLDPQKADLSREEELSAEVLETQSDNPLVNEIMRTQMFDEEGRPFSPSEEQARTLLEEARSLSQMQTTAKIPFQYSTPETFRNEIKGVGFPITSSAGSINSLVTAGKNFTTAFNNRGSTAFNSTDPDSVSLQNVLTNAGLISNGQATIKLGNVFAIQLMENILDELNKKSQLAIEGLDPEDSYTYDDSFDSMFEEVETNAPLAKLNPGAKINPLFERHRFGRGILNRALENQGEVGAATVLFGGEGDRADPRVLAQLDGLAYEVLNEMGFITDITEDGNTFYQFTENGINFFDNVREVLDDVFPERSILPSLTPLVNGVGFGLERNRGFRAAGNKSIKSKDSETDNEEKESMHHMGRIAMRVANSGLNNLSNIIHSNIRYNIKNRRVILSRKAFIDQHPTKFCSTHPTASVLGISEADWDKYYYRASARADVATDADAREQADMIVAMQARLRVKNLMIADQFKDRSIYMKRFYASANNRFHFRNSAFDPQNSKAVRNILISAQPNYIDANSTTGMIEDWKYIIGRALLKPEDFQTVNPKTRRAEDMGWNSTLKLSKDILFTKEAEGGRFETVRREAKLIRRLSNTLDPNAFREAFELLPDNLKAVFSNKDDWGLITQAYIDFADYADAIDKNRDQVEFVPIYPVDSNGEITSVRMQQLQQMLQDAIDNQDQDAIQIAESDILKESQTMYKPIEKTRQHNPNVFQARAVAKHDGKQSGMAIYGTLYGIDEMISRVGLMYSDESNIINEGDIRDYFMEHLMPSISGQIRQAEVRDPFIDLFSKYLNDPESAKEFGKALSRAPLMETSYGSYIGFQHETVMAMFNHPKFGQEFGMTIDMIKQSVPSYSTMKAIADLNLVIANTLHAVLNINYQVFLKDIAAMYAAMGETPRFLTPTGKYIYFGSREVYDTGDFVNLQLPGEEVQRRPITATRPSGTKRTSSIPLVYDMELGKLVKGEKSMYGQETINQLPVLFIQAIDAAVMAKTFNFVNKNKNTPLFAVDIHDSLITDARSVREYHSTYNRIFKELVGPTEKGYKPFEVLKTSYEDTILSFINRIDSDKEYLVSSDSPQFRALHDQLINLVERLYQQENDNVSDELRSIFNKFRGPIRHLKRKKAIQELGDRLKNWRPEGAMLTGREIKDIIRFLNSYRLISQRFKDLSNEVNTNLYVSVFGYDSIESRLAEIAYQLN